MINKMSRLIAVLGLGAALVAPLPTFAQILAGQNEPNFRNLVDNGAFNIAQRGTTTVSSITTTATYLHDRWAATAGTSTSSSIANSTGSPTLPTGFTNAALVQRTAAQTGVVRVCLVQEVPTADVTPIAGQPVTLSFYLAAGANLSSAAGAVVAQITTGTTADEGLATWLTGLAGAASAIPTANATVTPTTGYQRFAVTGTIPATAIEAVVNICFTPVGTAGTTDGIFVTGVQLERGTVASNFEWRPLGIETVKVQRYFYQLTETAAITPVAPCMNSSVTVASCLIQFPVAMRRVPTMTYANGFATETTAAGGTLGACTTLAASALVTSTAANVLNALASCTAATVPAAGTAGKLFSNGGTGKIQASADF